MQNTLTALACNYLNSKLKKKSFSPRYVLCYLPLLYHESYDVKKVEQKSPTVESSTWPLNSHSCSENYTKIKLKIIFS